MKGDELVYLIGKTGSGKSSLLKMLYGELPLGEGTGEVLLTDRSVGDNLKFVMGATGWHDKRLMERRALEVLQLVGLEQKSM
ncbi:hypothetical protein ANCCEY_15354 [Ancylostoma ceylanicum]|uniref:ABC transporter domain-containing protein n=1 Tax=Ancylostoma ceylanicum TaxID=53326 RepID=A0A0D6L3R3_9BILA|nr:hypothetical protein ANCCEY_15354 [Ancylostoma ceylanicum]